VRVPLLNGSLTDCVFEVQRPTTAEEVNALFMVPPPPRCAVRCAPACPAGPAALPPRRKRAPRVRLLVHHPALVP
jgi:hypothetical protein